MAMDTFASVIPMSPSNREGKDTKEHQGRSNNEKQHETRYLLCP